MTGLCVGEKVETIIYSRRDGKFGRYLGASAMTFGAAEVNGVVFKVQRNIEVGEGWVWRVMNVNTGVIAENDDRHGMAFAVRDAA